MMIDNDDGQMTFGDLGDLKLPDIRLTGEEEPRKNLTQQTCPDRDRTRARCMRGAHATAWPIAVNMTKGKLLQGKVKFYEEYMSK